MVAENAVIGSLIIFAQYCYEPSTEVQTFFETYVSLRTAAVEIMSTLVMTLQYGQDGLQEFIDSLEGRTFREETTIARSEKL